MKEELRKSLTDLIDETLLELEELKKSRFAASEIELKGPGEGIAGKPSNGDLHAKKAEKDKEEDEKDEEAEKAEGHNRQSDPDGGHHKPVAGEGSEHGAGPSDSPHAGKSRDSSGKNSESDPGQTHKVAKGDEDEDDKKKKKDKDAKGGEEHEKKEKEAIKDLANLAGMKKGESPSPEQADKEMRSVGMRKSDEEFEGLMKSFVEERVKPLEDKLSTILNLVNKIAEQPVAPKGVTARAVPLLKSADEGAESLSKSEVASKLFELKKSGTKVDSLDITRAEMGHDLSKIIEKYKIS